MGPARPPSASITSTIAIEGQVRGWKNIHITDGDHPYMKNWWVPGLQIGYEHTFIHQVADFIRRPGWRSRCGPDIPRWTGHRPRDRCSFEICEDQKMGRRCPPENQSRLRFKEEDMTFGFVSERSLRSLTLSACDSGACYCCLFPLQADRAASPPQRSPMRRKLSTSFSRSRSTSTIMTDGPRSSMARRSKTGMAMRRLAR